MNSMHCLSPAGHALAVLALSILISGCASTGDKPAAGSGTTEPGRKFKADDGRIIDVGKATPADGGTLYDHPHMEKGKCWVADGFDFKGYDTIYVAPIVSTAKFPDKPEDAMVHKLARERLVEELVLKLDQRGIVANVVTNEADIKSGAKVLKLENTIVEFSKGGGAARYFAGEFGAGQPVLRVDGKVLDGAKPVFKYQMRRSGQTGTGRVFGGFMKDEDIQIKDVRSLVLDLTDFMAVLAKRYPLKS